MFLLTRGGAGGRYTRGKQGQRNSFDFNGWCIAYTTAPDCVGGEWGRKANEGVVRIYINACLPACLPPAPLMNIAK